MGDPTLPETLASAAWEEDAEFGEEALSILIVDVVSIDSDWLIVDIGLKGSSLISSEKQKQSVNITLILKTFNPSGNNF